MFCAVPSEQFVASTHVATRAPLTVSRPPPTTAEPPPCHSAAFHIEGIVVPEHSVPRVGARITSPSIDSDTYVLVNVPALKSADVVSCTIGCGMSKPGSGGGVIGFGAGPATGCADAVLPAVSAETTR